MDHVRDCLPLLGRRAEHNSDRPERNILSWAVAATSEAGLGRSDWQYSPSPIAKQQALH